jgi:hypothetical protein
MRHLFLHDERQLEEAPVQNGYHRLLRHSHWAPPVEASTTSPERSRRLSADPRPRPSSRCPAAIRCRAAAFSASSPFSSCAYPRYSISLDPAARTTPPVPQSRLTWSSLSARTALGHCTSRAYCFCHQGLLRAHLMVCARPSRSEVAHSHPSIS